MISKRRLLQSLAASACAPAAWAQQATPSAAPRAARTAGAWPTQPVRLLVGFPAGASPDLAARAIAEPLSKLLGQPVTVENKPGASGNLAADLVAKSQDDHTIGALINGNLTIAKLLNPATPFDPEKDFAPVGLIGTAPLVLAVSGNAVGPQRHRAAAVGAQPRRQGQVRHARRRHRGPPGHGTAEDAHQHHAAARALQRQPAGHRRHARRARSRWRCCRRASPSRTWRRASSRRSASLRRCAARCSANCPRCAKRTCAAPTSRSGPRSRRRPTCRSRRSRSSTRRWAKWLRSAEVQQQLLTAGWQAQAGTPQALAYRMRSDTSQLGGVILMRGIRSEA